MDTEPRFTTALQAVLEVLPVGKETTGIDEGSGPVAESSKDFEVLEKLRRLAFVDRVPEPEQLGLWKDGAGS
jgi:hypothetical protein